MAAIDALRGAIMVIMALDHVRDFVHRAAMSTCPIDLATTTPALYLTRWITHLCAPVFMLTAGLGASATQVHPGPLRAASSVHPAASPRGRPP